MIILTYDQKKNKHLKAGDFKDGVYIRKVKPCHYMRILNSYGMSEDVATSLKHLDCKKVELRHKSGTLESDFKDWLEAPLKDYGHGKQYFLSLKKMRDF